MAWILATIILILLPYLIQLWRFKSKTKGNKLPPGPKAFPIIGNLHLLGKLLHRDFHHLSQKYGPIMHMRLGLIPTIIVSSPQAAELFLKAHDLVFAGRPLTQTSNQMSYGRKNMAFAEYGPYWRNARKMCTFELLSTSKINSFRSMREEELGLLIYHLQEAAKNRVVVDLSSKISSLTADMTCLMVFGKKYADKELDQKGFKAVIQEATQLVAAPNLGDFIPFIAAFDLQGLCRRAKGVSKVFDGFLEKIIIEHLKSKNQNKTKDFVDVMLDLMESQESDYRIDRSSIKAIILDLLVAAIDTSATAIKWALPELIKHPLVVKKMQDELERVVGLDRMVQELDLSRLEYLEMVVKEVLRLHPPIPLVPRESIQDCTVNGYHVPKKSSIVINAWAIGRDPNIWIDPDKFLPERFFDSQMDVKGRDFQLIPFGSGRRGCPGMHLALTVIRLVVAQLMHCFDWELPNGMSPTELDMTEEFSLTCLRAQNFMAIPIYRLGG